MGLPAVMGKVLGGMPRARDKGNGMQSKFKVGETLVVVARVGLFVPLGQVLEAPAVANLKLVELTIVEEVEVSGNYNPESRHLGYTAKGSDGWMYGCQNIRFDEASSSPYQNWQRIYQEGTHYRKDEHGRIGEWLIDKEAEFNARYLNWEVTMVMGGMPTATAQAMAARINAEFPGCQVAQCTRFEAGSDDDHREFGWFYSKYGCGFCNLMAQPSEAAEAQAG
jgi:hypothetical protein